MKMNFRRKSARDVPQWLADCLWLLVILAGDGIGICIVKLRYDRIFAIRILVSFLACADYVLSVFLIFKLFTSRRKSLLRWLVLIGVLTYTLAKTYVAFDTILHFD
jgi:hypothetical protein